ncbi:hypothetical protein GH714_008619 [Hevea brasiliensis]|uniref:Uncharacterized protein n=1 Tax=Hevea brasiliensis TaxID=3981 RepID=A0A6A6NA75_HEVBR|nr:hypothetical protein GH714_008619 [Hevea brasiliensis]
MVADHYLAIREWHPNFDPENAVIHKALVCIRILNLLIEYYARSLLLRVGNKIRHPIKGATRKRGLRTLKDLCHRNNPIVLVLVETKGRSSDSCRAACLYRALYNPLWFSLFPMAKVPPDIGWMKLNTDGTCRGNPGRSGASGVLRDK